MERGGPQEERTLSTLPSPWYQHLKDSGRKGMGMTQV